MHHTGGPHKGGNMEHLLIFALGALFGPAVGRVLRPVLRSAIRGGVVVGRQVRDARDSLAEITDEAKAELNAQETVERTAAAPRPASRRKRPPRKTNGKP